MKVYGSQKHKLSDNWIPAQLWVVSQVGDDAAYTIENTNSRTYLDLTDGNPKIGTPIIGYQSTDNQHQGHRVHNQASGTYVDLLNGHSASLTPVNGWTGMDVASTNPHQLWKFVRA
ncbi:ricin B-like lectin [Fomitopsis betulina]|nr:ricin B-like lectin [Fomitopsis betulina]